MKTVKLITCILFLPILVSLLACEKTNNIIVEEYALETHPEEPSSSPLYPKSTIPLEVPQNILAKHESSYSDLHIQTLEYNNELMDSFGYGIDPHSHAIYKDQHSFHDVTWDGSSRISINAAKSDFILMVGLPDPEGQGTYRQYPLLLTKDRLENYARYAPADDCSLSDPVYVGNELAFVRTYNKMSGIQIEVQSGNRVVYAATLEALLGNHTINLWGFNEHWVMEYRQRDRSGSIKGHLVQDGHEINQTLAYQETFGFALLHDLPFFFYQKDSKFGMSYNGQEHPLNFDEIYHFGCCDDSFFNPGYSLEKVSFFARRDSQWYHVEAYVP